MFVLLLVLLVLLFVGVYSDFIVTVSCMLVLLLVKC